MEIKHYKSTIRISLCFMKEFITLCFVHEYLTLKPLSGSRIGN